MSYIFFKHNENDNFAAFTEEVGFMCALDTTVMESDYHNTGYEWFSRIPLYYLEEEASDAFMLLHYVCFYCNNNEPVFYLYVPDRDISSDHRIIARYGDDYLGTFDNAVNSKELVEVLVLVYKMVETNVLKNSTLTILNEMLKKPITYLNLTDIEKTDLEQIIISDDSPLIKWCDNRIAQIKTEIEQHSIVIKRGFSKSIPVSI